MLRWYLIHTKPLCEDLARRNLERQGYPVYLPRLAQPIWRSGRVHDHVGPLFPRYVFLRLAEGDQALSPVHSTIGVAKIVRFGARFALVPDELIESLRSREDSSGLHRIASPPSLVAGSEVTITAGPFDGFEAVFERHAGADRVVVLLDLLGQNASVCVAIDSIAPSRAA
jgi:transcriptional antiterminator RfaH